MTKNIIKTKVVTFLALAVTGLVPRLGWADPERGLLADDGEVPGEARVLPTPSGRLLAGDDDDELLPALPPGALPRPTPVPRDTATVGTNDPQNVSGSASGTPPPPSPGTTGGFDMKDPISRAQYKVMLAVVDYKKKPSDVLYNQALVAMERRVQVACMGGIMKDLEYKGPPETAQCQEAIAQLRAVNPESTSLACAVHGIASRPCQSAEASTKSVLVSLSDFDKDLVSKISLHLERNGERLRQLERNYKDTVRALSSAKVDAPDMADMKVKEQEQQQEYLKVACTETLAQLRVAPRPAVIVHESSKDPYGLRQMLEKHQPASDATPVASPPPGGDVPFPDAPSSDPQRPTGGGDKGQAASAPEGIIPRVKVPMVLVRAIPRSCFEAIRNVYQYNPQSPLALCAEFGGFSPKCVLALKKFRAEQGKATVRSSSSGSSKVFSEF